MKKTLKILLISLIAIMAFAACSPAKTKPNPKTIYGQAPIFADDKGFYENDPVIIQTDAQTRYAYFTTNAAANVEGDVIAVRKGVKSADGWTYEGKKVILNPTAGSWDSKRVNNPAVIKGTFAYNGKTYSYLMAYSGNNKTTASDYQIGFALSESPDGSFVKAGALPFVTFNGDQTGGTAFGAGEPSLVSYDNAGKLRLFFTYSDARMTTVRAMDLDCSDMSSIKDGGFVTLGVAGIADGEKMLANTAVAYSSANSRFYIVRDRFPKSAIEPLNATSISVMSATADWLYKPDHELMQESDETPPVNSGALTQIKNIVEDDVYVEGSDGWTRIYSGSIVTDAYGKTLSDSSLEIVFSVNIEQLDDDDITYKFSSVICSKVIDIS